MAPFSQEDEVSTKPGQLHFTSDPDLAFDWLTRRLREKANEDKYWLIDSHGPAVMALSKLRTEQRIALLRLVPDDLGWCDFVAHVVGDDLVAYKTLLKDPDKKDLHLGPLRGGAEKGWKEKALAALAAGLAPAEIARETLCGGGWTFSGSEAEHWKSKLAELEKAIAGHPEMTVILDEGRQLLAPRIEASERAERAIELYGLHGEP